MDLADIFFRKMVITMSYKLKFLFIKPKNIDFAIRETKKNCDEIFQYSEKRLDYFYQGISDDDLLNRLNKSLMVYQGSLNNYFEVFCLIIGFISISLQVDLFFQLWNYESIGSIRIFLVNMFVTPICAYLYFSKKKEEKSLLNECSIIHSILKKRKVI